MGKLFTRAEHKIRKKAVEGSPRKDSIRERSGRYLSLIGQSGEHLPDLVDPMKSQNYSDQRIRKDPWLETQFPEPPWA